MAETPTPTPEPIKPIIPVEAPKPVEGEAKGFGDLLEILGTVVDTEVVLDEMNGRKRDVGDIMKDVLAATEQKLAAAKATREAGTKK